MRLAFFGTAPAALPTLHAVAEAHTVDLVVTQPARPRGRSGALVASPVAAAAAALGLRVATPERLRADPLAGAFPEEAFDAGVVVAYGQILPPPVVHGTRLGLVNLHFSRLPRWRGAAPVERALLAGDPGFGITTLRVADALDAGDVLLSEWVPDDGESSAGELTERLARQGAPLVVRSLAGLAAGTLQATRQAAEGVTYAARLQPEEGWLHPGEPVAVLHRSVRAFTPRPGAFLTLAGLSEGTLPGARLPEARLKVWRARPGGATAPARRTPGTLVRGAGSVLLATADGWLELLEVQPEGRARMAAAAWARGRRRDLPRALP